MVTQFSETRITNTHTHTPQWAKVREMVQKQRNWVRKNLKNLIIVVSNWVFDIE